MKEIDDYAEQGLPEAVMPACPVVNISRGKKRSSRVPIPECISAIALALGHAGADVLVNYVSREEEAGNVCEEIRRCGSKALRGHRPRFS